MDAFRDFQPKDQDEFRRIMRRLIAETFIVRNKDDVSRGDYNFVRRYFDAFNDAFEPMGYVVQLDVTSGVAALKMAPQAKHISFANREPFTYSQALFLAILWQYYFKSKRELNEHVIINKETLDEELKVANRDFKKTEIDEAVKKLKRHNIVSLIKSESITDDNGQMYIYPSIKLALDENECKNIYDAIRLAAEASELEFEEEESEETNND